MVSFHSMKTMLALLALIVVTATDSMAQETLRVGVDDSYPPLAYRNEDGQLEGFDIDVAYAICAEMRRRCQLLPSPFSTMIDLLRGGKIDMAVVSMSITDERKELVAFSVPYYRAPNRFIGQPDLADRVSSDDGLSDLTIGVRQGTTFDRYAMEVLAPANKVIRYPLQEEIYLDLSMGRLDLALSNELTAGAGFLDSELGGAFETIGPVLTDSTFFGYGEAVALRQSDTALRQNLNEAIESLREDGGLVEIWKRYFTMSPEEALAKQ